MNPWRWVDPRVSSIRLAGVRAYLERRGFVEQPEANPSFTRFEAPPGPNGELPPFFVLPTSERFGDYVQSLTYFLTTLSEVEDRHPDAIVEELLREQPVECRPARATPGG
jgi:hypothetical protein